MTILKRDNNELRYNSIWLLDKRGNPDYYKQLFRNTKAFFYGMNRPDLDLELDKLVHKRLEKWLGTSIQNILLVYKNMPYLNSFTRTKTINTREVYKYDIERRLDEIEKWVFQTAITLEGDIIFSIPPKQYM
jgi:hypothetical protein